MASARHSQSDKPQRGVCGHEREREWKTRQGHLIARQPPQRWTLTQGARPETLGPAPTPALGPGPRPRAQTPTDGQPLQAFAVLRWDGVPMREGRHVRGEVTGHRDGRLRDLGLRPRPRGDMRAVHRAEPGAVRRVKSSREGAGGGTHTEARRGGAGGPLHGGDGTRPTPALVRATKASTRLRERNTRKQAGGLRREQEGPQPPSVASLPPAPPTPGPGADGEGASGTRLRLSPLVSFSFTRSTFERLPSPRHKQERREVQVCQQMKRE